MNSVPSVTPGSDDAAATTPPAVSVMTPSITTKSFDSSFTITLADFAPICRAHPRPWDRVPVPAASVYITLRKIWKRVGALPLPGDHAHYLKTTAELHANGQGPRKVPRTLLHVPVWGDAAWREASIDDVPPEAVVDTPTEATQHDATLPRKRNSQRQLITPGLRAAPTLPTADAETATEQAEIAPALPPTSPTSTTKTASPPKTDELPEETAEHITRRTKRRLSRRVSIFPQFDCVSPEKPTPPASAFASSVKRRVSFFILDSELPMAGASPTKVISPSAPFEPVLLSSPIKAPASTQLLSKLDTTIEEVDETALPTATPVVPQQHVVVFTQPTAEIEAESSPQARRRKSLHNTRRRETWLAAADAIDFSVAGTKSKARSSRRHSVLPGQSLPTHKPLVFESTAAELHTSKAPATTSTKLSSRRHTFQPGTLASLFSASAELPSFAILKNTLVPEVTVSDASDDTTDTVDSTKQDETVVVDARTNLDIFGSGPPVQATNASMDRRASLDLEAQMKPEEPQPTDADCLTPESVKVKESAETAESKVAKAIPPSILEEDAAEKSSNSTPRDLSPDMDTPTIDSSPEITDEQSLVSRKRTSLALDESLLLPLPDTTETDTLDTDVDLDETMDSKPAQSNDGWQSPTSAELDLMADLFDTPSQPEPNDMPISPVMPGRRELDVELPARLSVDDDAMDDAEGDFDEIDDDSDEIDEDEESVSPEAGVIESKVQFESQVEQINTPLSPDSVSLSDDDNDDEMHLEQVDYTVTQPIHMLQHNEDEVTMTMTTMDLDALVEEQLSAHEDSETEMLRKFVTRVKADKSAKAKAAAAAADTITEPDSMAAAIRARNTLRAKRRSGSMGSTASASGSPMAKKEMKENGFENTGSSSILAAPCQSLDASRTPLGMKDSNMSPSPRKKRKELSSGVNILSSEKRSLRAGDHVDLLSKPSFDDHSPPRQKRRRKKMEADTGSIFNPEFMPSSKEKDAAQNGSGERDDEQAGPRRSKRTRSNQTPIKSSTSSATAATSAGGVLSLIPVRLPGSLNLNGEDSYGLSASGNANLALRRNDEKDLATMTRVNTRKNKSGSDPPSVVIQRLSQERAQEKWRAMVEKREQREQRERGGESIFDSPLSKDANEASDGSARKARKSAKTTAASTTSKPASLSKGKSKTVRWAEVLARFQATDSDQEAVPVGDAAAAIAGVGDNKTAEPMADAINDKDVQAAAPTEAAPTLAAIAAPAPAAPPPTAAPTAAEPEKKSIPRRTTRVSRLPPPTPSKVIASAAAAKASRAASASASVETTTTPGLKAPRMATRRAKIVGMGMAANGTPAPKRRTTRTT